MTLWTELRGTAPNDTSAMQFLKGEVGKKNRRQNLGSMWNFSMCVICPLSILSWDLCVSLSYFKNISLKYVHFAPRRTNPYPSGPFCSTTDLGAYSLEKNKKTQNRKMINEHAFLILSNDRKSLSALSLFLKLFNQNRLVC